MTSLRRRRAVLEVSRRLACLDCEVVQSLVIDDFNGAAGLLQLADTNIIPCPESKLSRLRRS
jgi:hypothetical protein